MQSDWKPCSPSGAVADDLSIPDFLNASRRPFLSHQRSQPNDSASPAAMISVLRDSHDCVGFLRSAGARGFQAYNADGQLIGLFHDNAIAAITAPNSTEMTNENLRTSKVA